MSTPIRLGMIGGGQGAFIGAVHRMAAALDGEFVLSAGCLSSTPERARASAEALGLPAPRAYPTWRDMLAGEGALPAGERVEVVAIVTPNHAHHAPARAFARAGFGVVCDKPMTRTLDEALDLVRTVRESGALFGVTYNYTGYPMVRQAREMIASGELGDVRQVRATYWQGWLASGIESTGHKQASWRTDPERAGLGGAIGDIGTHAENLVSFATGLEIDSLCADLASFVPGRAVDDAAGVLMRFAPRGSERARGVLSISQVAVGRENDLSLEVAGTRGTLSWGQENPNDLWVRSDSHAARLYRPGHAPQGSAAKGATRLPPGHPEGFIEAFANIYRAVARAHRARAGGLDAPGRFDFPGVVEGARGVHFVDRVLASARSQEKWTPARFTLPA